MDRLEEEGLCWYRPKDKSTDWRRGFLSPEKNRKCILLFGRNFAIPTEEAYEKFEILIQDWIINPPDYLEE